MEVLPSNPAERRDTWKSSVDFATGTEAHRTGAKGAKRTAGVLIIAVAIGWLGGLLLAAGGVAPVPQLAASAGLALAVGFAATRSRKLLPALFVLLALGAAALAQARYRGYAD